MGYQDITPVHCTSMLQGKKVRFWFSHTMWRHHFCVLTPALTVHIFKQHTTPCLPTPTAMTLSFCSPPTHFPSFQLSKAASQTVSACYRTLAMKHLWLAVKWEHSVHTVDFTAIIYKVTGVTAIQATAVSDSKLFQSTFSPGVTF